MHVHRERRGEFLQLGSARWRPHREDGVWGTDDDVGDLRLSPASPCIDAGSNLLALSGSIGADLDANLRFRDDPATPDTGIPGGLEASAIVDMGAYEYGSVPTPWSDAGEAGRRALWYATIYGGPFEGVAALAAHSGLTPGENTSLRIQTPIPQAGRLCVLVVSKPPERCGQAAAPELELRFRDLAVGRRSLRPASNREDAVPTFDRRSTERLPENSGGDVAALDTCLLRPEVHQQVEVAISVDVLQVAA